eukprot:CAMPEP_0182428400 /NCGR_PEP_ID=MMETSP1167-20130531/22844_1 /TAXON_ID=2988 /ORGANISM="Mallomonas Sp, Strain CCMP3275" /LENGTH=169 /DNA_ID=CAMNT_0024611295 /DNA_START=103 /DNA_END=608 /DNA_ORIENTATION=+
MSELILSSSGVPTRKEVSESAFEFLLEEILSMHSSAALPARDDQDAALAFQERIDSMGYEIGYRYVEKVAQQRPLPTDNLEMMKFICKDFWEEIFRKKIDKLQTNHRGVFVLSDLKFRWLEKYSSDDSSSKKSASAMLYFVCGIIRGALANLGLPASVTADMAHMPNCT